MLASTTVMIKTAYLAGYNVVSAVGWAYILWHLCSLLYDDADVVLSSAKLWSRIAIPLKYLQTMALLEVVHALVGVVPDWLFFLRYHLYLILYITGLVGELTCMVNALPFLSTGIYSIELPNKHNIAISLHAVVCGMLVLYVVCCPVMYKHMTTQRINAYAKKHGDNNVKAK
ncbi:hypothetical protein DYB38_004327 [Aphanomyces astaci]|uniref:very-long-chain (3R)-3-hydroxyacyl-CoA dehydratase n=1 Tax=Aphanomyces astaci TaxID=112090 RepID=A0A397F8R2_APHAT|nr:hypothetical protein DYB38_004327 [Aphanomyces astaci]RHZ18899.1 hypothetical protein DYB31_005256 [Aphanomyces astaci]